MYNACLVIVGFLFLQQFCEVICPKKWVSILTSKIIIPELLIWEFWQIDIYNSSLHFLQPVSGNSSCRGGCLRPPQSELYV